MTDDCEIIALLLDDADGRPRPRSELARGAQCLVRNAEGRMALQAVESEEQFDETMRTSACFRRGKEIRDPHSREVIGYEMEAVYLKVAAR